MSDIFFNPYPARFVDSAEPGLLAAYTFADGELAQFGRYINRGYGGAAYDLTTRVGTPIVGQGGGVHVVEQAGSYWQGAAIPVGASDWSYDVIFNNNTLIVNPLLITRNGGHAFAAWNNGRIRFTADNAVTYSEVPQISVGYGPVFYSALYNGANQILLANGRQMDTDAVVPAVPAGNTRVGVHCETLLYKVYNIRRTVAQARVSYVREMAKVVVAHWQPAAVGEGPAGGLVTGQCLDELYCPSGHSSLKFVYDRENNQLGLQCDWSVSYYRLSTPRPRRPLFGSWLLRFKTRASASAGEGIVFGFVNNRTQEPTITPASYWGMIWSLGGIWTARLHRGNVPVVLLTTQLPSIPPNGTNIDVLITRDVAGNWRLGMRAGKNPWVYNDATVANDVTYLDFQYLVVDPQGSMFLSMTEYQSEMTPSEGNF